MISIGERCARAAALHLARHTVPVTLQRPVVSFTFDDFPRSALLTGGKILEGFGVRGTYYVSMGLLGKTTELGRLFIEDDLIELTCAGHELACHTYSHNRCRTLQPAQLIESCELNRAAVRKILPGHELRNFSFPYGSISLRAKKTLASQYWSCRSIQPGINRPKADISFLRAYSLYSSPEIVKAALAHNARQLGWMIVYTHDVAANPSRYGCTANAFSDVVRTAVSVGADILPVREVLRQLARADSPQTIWS